MLKELIPLFVSQALFCGILLFLLRKKIKAGTYWITIIIASLAPFVFVVGYFLGSFNSNICYSESIASLSSLIKLSVDSKDPKKMELLLLGLNKLPLYGYESECSQVYNSIIELENNLKK